MDNSVKLVIYNTEGSKPRKVLTLGVEGLRKAVDISEKLGEVFAPEKHHTDISVRCGRFWIYIYELDFLAKNVEQMRANLNGCYN